jgi:hypothetical protein
MIETVVFATLLGGATGVLLGFLVSAIEGIRPHVWIYFILTLALFGAVVGVIDYSAADVPPGFGGE